MPGHYESRLRARVRSAPRTVFAARKVTLLSEVSAGPGWSCGAYSPFPRGEVANPAHPVRWTE